MADLPVASQFSLESALVQVVGNVLALAAVLHGLIHPEDDGLLGWVVHELFDGPAAMELFQGGEVGGGDGLGLDELKAIGELIMTVLAVRNVAGELVLLEQAAHLLGGAVTDLGAFPFGHGQQHGEDHAADVALGGDGLAAEVHDVQGDVVLLAEFQDADAVADVASQAVELGDDEMFHAASAEPVHQQASAVAFQDRDAAGGVGIGKDEGVFHDEAFHAGVIEDAAFLEFQGIVLLVGGDTAIDGGEFGIHRQNDKIDTGGAAVPHQLRRRRP